MNPLYYRIFRYLSCLFVTGISLFLQEVVAQSPINAIYLGTETQKKCTGERKAAFEFLSGVVTINVAYLTASEIHKKSSNVNAFSVVWYHRPDTNALSPAETESKFVDALKDYVVGGGSLILSLDALRLLPLLGIEPATPESRYVNAVDEGYGRKLGLHSFRNHPIFDSLFGGAYLFAPDKDMQVRQMGWFGNNQPAGKTVAVDWAYINLLENSKLVAEYSIGKGTVLAIGAYTRFGEYNHNAAQLAVFMRNCFRYLSSPAKKDAKYWEYGMNEVLPFSSPVDSVFPGNAQSWLPGSEAITLRKKYASLNPWDVAGESILLMGKESGGIDEIWAHPFMAIRDFEAGIIFQGNDSIFWLNTQQPEIEVRPESFNRVYRFRRAYLTEIIACHPTDAIAVVHYELKSISPARLVIKLKSNLRFMWPYSEKVTGQIRYDWNPGLNSFMFRDKSGDFIVLAGANRKPVQHLAGRYDDFTRVSIPPDNDRMVRADSVFHGIPTDKFQAAALMLFDMKANDQLDMIITASANGQLEAVHRYKQTFPKPIGVHLTSLRYNNSLFNKKLNIVSPDQRFNEGYKWAIVGTDRFFVNTPGIGRSLVAGYATTDYGWDGGHKVNGRPGYAWYFGRDGVWSSYAALSYGDFEKVRSVLEMFGKYQDISGKIYHELTTSGVAHYDAADATPLYVSLAGRYLRYSGDTAFIRMQWNHIFNALQYCYSTDTDGDGLIENTLVGHGWEEGGALFGTHTTFYLASCWAEALHQACYMAMNLGYGKEAQQFSADEGKVLKIMNTDFWNPERNYFFHGKYKDTTYHPEPDVMAAVPLLYGQVTDSAKWEPVLRTIASNEFSTDWGVRILGDNSPFFKPGSYHQGSVWPLFTGWASLAEYKHGRSNQGFTHLMNNLLTYRSWSQGFVPEVLHGTEYKPFGVCAHQCWSETMVLQPALEGMLGLQPDAQENRLTLSPRFPADWDSVTVKNIRMGDCLFDMNLLESSGKATWQIRMTSGKKDKIEIRLNLEFPYGTKIHRVLVNGREAEPEIHENLLGLNLVLSGELMIEIFKSSGVCALPEVPEPRPGYGSEGYRIISENLTGQTFTLKLNGKSSSEAVFRLYAPNGFRKIPVNCSIVDQSGNISTYRYRFPDADSKYVTVPLAFILQ